MAIGRPPRWGGRATPLAMLLLTLLALAGCGSGSTVPGSTAPTNPGATSSSPASSGSGPGTYFTTFGGVEVSLLLPAEAEKAGVQLDKLKSEVESATKIKLDPYILGKFVVVNKTGEQTSLAFISFSVRLKDGTIIRSSPADSTAANWRDVARNNGDTALADKADALVQQLSTVAQIAASQTKAGYVTFSEFDPDDIKIMEAWYGKGGLKKQVMQKQEPKPSQ